MDARRPTIGICHLTALILLFLASGCARSAATVKIDTEYTSVFMDNGQVFVGKLQRIEPSYILLKDVFHIKSWVVQDKDNNKEIRNTISVRNNEAHNPDITYINTQHVLVIEPVAGNSRVSELIKQAKTQNPESGK